MTTMTHGESRVGRWTRRYRTWVDMHRRCRDPDYNCWNSYGGRGIRVCKRWKRYENFVEDMGLHPGKGWTLERKHNNLGYWKSNCKWAVAKEQAWNKRNMKLTRIQAAEIRKRRFAGETGPALAKEFGTTRQHVYQISLGKQWIGA